MGRGRGRRREVQKRAVGREVVPVVDACKVVEICMLQEGLAVKGVHEGIQGHEGGE